MIALEVRCRRCGSRDSLPFSGTPLEEMVTKALVPVLVKRMADALETVAQAREESARKADELGEAADAASLRASAAPLRTAIEEIHVAFGVRRIVLPGNGQGG